MRTIRKYRGQVYVRKGDWIDAILGDYEGTPIHYIFLLVFAVALWPVVLWWAVTDRGLEWGMTFPPSYDSSIRAYTTHF